MTRKVLVAYATKHGSTAEVAEAVAATLAEEGLDVDVERAAAVESVAPYELVVLGGSIYMGRWHEDAKSFLKRHADALSGRRLALFAMGPRTLAEADVLASRQQLESSLKRFPQLEPVAVAIFGGVVDPEKLHFPFSRMPASDARDWDAIRRWTEELAGAPVRLS